MVLWAPSLLKIHVILEKRNNFPSLVFTSSVLRNVMNLQRVPERYFRKMMTINDHEQTFIIGEPDGERNGTSTRLDPGRNFLIMSRVANGRGSSRRCLPVE